ncbi:MAG: dNTP triphosphohydrolase [Chlorobi bacterium]|nr:dNTP triphosphohydrolase [Chlorobiota bacterium]
MEWHKLLTTSRTGKNKVTGHHDRTQFQRDFDRLVFSSPFRRLQNKTQVFPLPGSVFVHNRLTHSLEVASVGRSLGNNISKALKERSKTTGESLPELIDEIGYVVAAACLAHDLGNPPFGHSGEKAISEYFKNGEGQKYKDACKNEWTDLISFEGNANALRILTHQFKGRQKGGYALTYTTVASIIKYPFPSYALPDTNKYGFFASEKDIFLEIMDELEITKLDNKKNIFARHPLVYLVEAADDICYQIMDIEDAHKLRILSFDETKELYFNFFSEDEKNDPRINEVFTEVTDPNERIAFLRARVIGKLVNECTNIYLENYREIMNGTFNKALIKELKNETDEAMKTISGVAFKQVYKHPSVVEVELSGFKILGTLIHEFTNAVMNPELHYSGMLLPFIPEQYRIDSEASVYEKIQSVLDFVSGMTDVYALDLYNKLQGTGLQTK